MRRGILVLLLTNEGSFWYKAPCCCFRVDVYSYFLMGSGWPLDGLWYTHLAHSILKIEGHT